MAVDELYYDAGESHDFLNKLVSDHVAKAIAFYWKEEPPIANIQKGFDGVYVQVIGPYKPIYPSGYLECYTVNFNLIELLDEVLLDHGPDDGRVILNAIIDSAKKALADLEEIVATDPSYQ